MTKVRLELKLVGSNAQRLRVAVGLYNQHHR